MVDSFAKEDFNIAKVDFNNLQLATVNFTKWTGIMPELILKQGHEVIYDQKRGYIKSPLSLETLLIEEVSTGSLHTVKLSELSSIDKEVEQNNVPDISLLSG